MRAAAGRARVVRSLRFAALLAGLLLAHGAGAGEWRVDAANSSIGFTATYDEIPFDGSFREFDARIRFDPHAVDDSRFEVEVDIVSIDSNSPDRDEGMLTPEWFDPERHPAARFESRGFRSAGDDGFQADGDLSIKGITRPVTVFFSWTPSNGSARLAGNTRVKRTDFKIGTGDWHEDDTIGFDVEIVFDLMLDQ